MRAVTYNLLNGGLDDGDDARLLRQVDILAGLAPDVLTLQECTGWPPRLAEEVAAALGMSVALTATSGTGSGLNATVLFHRPSVLKLVAPAAQRGQGIYTHALIKAHLRPVDAEDTSGDFLALGTHLSWSGAAARLTEVTGYLTDFAGDFPGTPARALLMMDANTPAPYDRRPWRWSKIPTNLQPRYRRIRPSGRLAGIDRAAMRALLNAGWQDPQAHIRGRRAATVGYYYANERVPWHLDHILLAGPWPKAANYRTVDTHELRALADHLPVVLEI
ncbi:Exonuclease III [Actinacidiphila rubida]|uniref:Exonuclease III n=1 Tax=Actinacidiphila rubida TaxID=310780 RepID=A0A1H8TR33_9ACTN|nr:endonuclease/exonuclease/phosphatase family protein [Actinacidiphila rubida]SEO93462.1 Exonuclease III [Actinacidiphila rubida]